MKNWTAQGLLCISFLSGCTEENQKKEKTDDHPVVDNTPVVDGSPTCKFPTFARKKRVEVFFYEATDISSATFSKQVAKLHTKTHH